MDEIRIEISGGVSSGPGPLLPQLIARVAKCPRIPASVNTKDEIQLLFSRADLVKLRSKPAQPDLIFLRKLGDQVKKFLGSNVWGVIQALRAISQNIRIIIYMDDSAIREIGADRLRPDEIPLELIWDSNNDFYALNLNTPIIRGPIEADRPSEIITIPLKILVIVSTPKDKPPSSIDKEKEVIQKALAKHLFDEGTGKDGIISIQWCIPGTKRDFKDALRKFKPHIVHFIGHGGFEVDIDGNPAQGFLCFQDEQNYSDPMSADDLAVLLRNNPSVKLVIMTACSSAQPAPLDPLEIKPYDTLAFEGVAQKLISGASGVTAVVAMQFDIEENAAVEFTRSFYDELLKPKVPLEEIVTQARIAISTILGNKHPAWVCPVLFSRSKDGNIFDIRYLVGNLNQNEEKEISELDVEIKAHKLAVDTFRKTISNIPPEIKPLVQPELDRFLQKIRDVEVKRSQILGDSIRILGERTQKNINVVLPINFRARKEMNIDRIQFNIQYPLNSLLN